MTPQYDRPGSQLVFESSDLACTWSNHLLTMYMLNLNFKILGEILVCHTGGGGVNHLLTMSMLNLNFKTLGEILVCHTGGSIIF